MPQLPFVDLLQSSANDVPAASVHRVFCNRNLRLDRTRFVGFDMDYTLAVYNQPEIDRLSIEATARKLVERGYPETLTTMPYRPDFPIRGLLVDRKLGNVLKMDRYKYVKVAHHGMRKLSSEERHRLYHTKRVRPATKRYHWVDTLYALSEVSVYAAAIDALEVDKEAVDYDRLFGDVRECIDIAHRDGSILDVVARDFPRYVVRDPTLAPTLHKLRSAGKKLFLLTSSRLAYTDKMMAHLLEGVVPEYPTWRHFFDVIVTAARKPTFFTGDAPLEERMPDGSVKSGVTALERGHMYSGGNIGEFERLLGAVGDAVLYVGDHIYGDVLRAKKETAWRTVMIVQEMREELEANKRAEGLIRRMDGLERLHDHLCDELRDAQAHLKVLMRRIDQLAQRNGHGVPPELEAERVLHRKTIDRLRARLREVTAELDRLEDEISAVFHPFWGSIFKAGPEASLFGDQVEKYACLYTDRVTNFLHYAPTHYFRSPRDRMPHEL